MGGAVRPKFKSWLHCLALGKWLSHSVPEFPVFTKLIPMTIKYLLCAKHFYLWLLPQPALRRLEVVSSPPFYKQITKTWWGGGLSHSRLVRVMQPGLVVGLVEET